MELLAAVVIAVLFAGAVYMMLSRVTLRVVIGTCLLSYATFLYLMTIGRLERGAGPILEAAKGVYTDPIPQALILTAIVIGFGVTAFVIVLAYKANQSMGSDDLNDYRGDCLKTGEEEKHEY